MHFHTRNYIIVSGDPDDNYFDKTMDFAKKYALQKNTVLIGYDLRDRPGNGILELVTDSEEFRKDLEGELKLLDPTKQIESGAHTVDIDNQHARN